MTKEELINLSKEELVEKVVELIEQLKSEKQTSKLYQDWHREETKEKESLIEFVNGCKGMGDMMSLAAESIINKSK